MTEDHLPEHHLNHLWFDFHHNRKNRQLQSLQRLYPAIFANRAPGYFELDENDQSIASQQRDVVRTNCIDCLDRTNVVQVSSQSPSPQRVGSADFADLFLFYRSLSSVVGC